MLIHKFEKNILDDSDYASRLNFPFGVNVYFIYRGGDSIEYYLYDSGNLIFSGGDYRPSAMHNIDGLESIVSLLGFLTCRPGDTDQDYFKDYNGIQFEWIESDNAEAIRRVIYDYEAGEDASWKESAVNDLNRWFTYGL